MREAVIVSYARTGMAKASRGSLNNTHGITMAGTAIKGAIERAGIEAGEIEVEDPREKRLQELKKQKAAEAAAKKKSAKAAAAKK